MNEKKKKIKLHCYQACAFIYTVASESVQDMMINERLREFCSLD